MRTKEQSIYGKMLYLLRQIHIHPAYLLIPISLSIVSALLEGVGIGLLIPILNGFLQQNFAFLLEMPVIGGVFQRLPEPILANDKMLFGILLTGFISLYIAKNIFKYFSIVCIRYFSQRTLHHLRKTLFAKYLSFGKLFFDRTNIGHHSTLLLEFSSIALRPIFMLDKLVSAVFSMLAYLAVMFFISWRLTLIALPLFLVLHLIVRTLVCRIKDLSRALAEQGNELGKKSVEILATIPLIKSSRTEHREQELYTQISDRKARLDFRVEILTALILPLQEIITVLVAAGVFVGALAWFGRASIGTAPMLIVYAYIIFNASNKFGAISGFRGTMAGAYGPLDKVLAIFNDTSKFFVRGGSKEFKGLQDAITFKNLSFSYTEGQDVLHNLSFRITRGEMTAIVGPTGAGKSTLINLLMRYYDCPEKSIFIDQTDIREFSLDSYIQRVALVSQDTLLLHDTLRSNIAYGLAHVSEEDMRRAVERARLSEFVAGLPEGLQTLIGDRGVRLSGGEKQRVSIARALLKEAEILILDEATSSLDSHTERLIQEAIDEATKDRTSIVIAHRLSTIQHADTILVIQNGRLVEEGGVQELLDRKGIFFELWEEQKF
ncbi:MAG: ABC transporter ATP-binding protein [Candidatus Peribacteraceae bacterium]|nr:ABC transporter ATP-binding protein [Candidatus Peribacteraceae bacterium]